MDPWGAPEAPDGGLVFLGARRGALWGVPSFGPRSAPEEPDGCMLCLLVIANAWTLSCAERLASFSRAMLASKPSTSLAKLLAIVLFLMSTFFASFPLFPVTPNFGFSDFECGIQRVSIWALLDAYVAGNQCFKHLIHFGFVGVE